MRAWLSAQQSMPKVYRHRGLQTRWMAVVELKVKKMQIDDLAIADWKTLVAFFQQRWPQGRTTGSHLRLVRAIIK